jgi:hypothetical protein
LFDFLYLPLSITGRGARSNYAYLYAYLFKEYKPDIHVEDVRFQRC